MEHNKIQPQGLFKNRSILITAAICLIASILILSLIITAARDIGWTYDEVYYFLSSELIIDWANALITAVIQGNPAAILSQNITDQYWLWDIQHNPHPPLYKILSGITLLLLKHVCGEFIAYRMSSALLCTALVLALFLILRNRYGIAAGLCGSISLLFMPRFFGHAPIAATEIPLTTFWFFSCWAFWRGLRERSGVVLLGIFWGCAVATKFTGFLLPAPLLIWTLLARQKQGIKNILLALPCALLLAFIVNPGWWHDPTGKIFNFIQASLSRRETIPIPTYYFGTTYSYAPPWTYALVMTAITTPITTLFVFLLGLRALVRDKLNRPFNAFVFINMLFPPLLTMLPKAPVHDGTRQFFYMYPFMAYFAGTGFHFLTERFVAPINSSVLKKAIVTVALIVFTLYPAHQTLRIHPYELCYYNELIGGIRGAHAAGMETTYWYDVVNREFLDALKRDIPRGAKVSMWVANQAYFEFLQDKGKIRKDIQFITPDITVKISSSGVELKFVPDTPEYLILLSRQGTFNAFYWNIYYKSTPVYSLTLDGVPLISIYHWRDIKVI